MKKNILLPAFVLFALMLSQPSMAREFAEIYTDCGLGAMIAPKSDAVAAVTNVTWDSGTTAITSDMSSPDTCQGGKQKTAAFIHESYEHIEKDIARGSGGYLDTLLAFSGCQASARPAITKALRGDFSKLVADPAYSGMSRYKQANALYDLYHARIANFSGPCSIG